MRIAVIISGKIRTLGKCAATLSRVIPKSADKFVYLSGEADLDDVAELNPRHIVVEPEQEIAERSAYTLQIGRGTHSVQGSLRQLHSLARAWKHFEDLGYTHDWVMRLRCDHLFLREIEPIEDWEHGIYIPEHENWYGLNDQFAFGSRDIMEKYFRRLERLDEYIDSGGIFHSESFLRWVIDQADVPLRRTRVWTVIMRSDNTFSGPFWGSQFGDVGSGIPIDVASQLPRRDCW
jgi:hypothetical protein